MAHRVRLKDKATLFMLLLISILLLTLYFQNKSSNKNFLIHVEKNYKTNFDNYHEFFQKQLLDFYEVQTLYVQNIQNQQALIKKEKFLKAIEVVHFKQKQLQTLYSNEALKGKSFLDIEVLPTQIYYKVIVPIITNDKVESYVVYTVDSRIFLNSVKAFDGSDGIIVVKDNNKDNDIFLDQNKQSDFFNVMAQKCEEEQDKPVVEYNDELYVKKIMDVKNFKNENVASAIFFLDITKDDQAFISTIRNSIFTSILLFIIAAIVVNYFFNYLIDKIEKKESELKSINKDLEQMVDKEIEHRMQIQKEANAQKEKK